MSGALARRGSQRRRIGMNTVAIIGIGNTLRGDDGVGIRAVRGLHEGGSAAGADLYDAGTAPFDALDVFLEHEVVIVLQALGAGRSPGTVYRATLDDLDPLSAGLHSAHGLGVPDTVRVARDLGACPKVVVLGVEPDATGWSVDLSGPVAAALPRLIHAAEREFRRLRAVAA
jgi:hydrogenase maturation protease